MVRLAILGETFNHGRGNPSYRGTYRFGRRGPTRLEEFGPDHEVMRAWEWFHNEGKDRNDRDYVHDLEGLRALVQVYDRFTNNSYEIVEITKDNEKPFVGMEFLGFDLSTGFNSFLWYGLDVCIEENALPAHIQGDERDLMLALRPLLCLVKAHFKPKLNANGLFNDYKTAQFCLDCIEGIRDLYDWFDEAEGFEVLGLYRVET